MPKGGERLRKIDRLQNAEAREATLEEEREIMRRSDEGDMLADVFEMGREEGAREASGGSRSRGRSRGRSRNRSMGRQARRLARPVRRELASGMRVAAVSLGLVVLFLVLNNARTAADAIDSVRAAIDWLLDPERGVPAPGFEAPLPDPADR